MIVCCLECALCSDRLIGTLFFLQGLHNLCGMDKELEKADGIGLARGCVQQRQEKSTPKESYMSHDLNVIVCEAKLTVW